MFRSRSEPPDQSATGKSRASRWLVVALAALTTFGALMPLGRSHGSSTDDRSAATTSTAATLAESSDVGLTSYVNRLNAWMDCLNTQNPPASTATTASTPSCGAMPARPDDPAVNAYVGALVEWYKCAGPRLKRGGQDRAVEACGPMPTPTPGG